MLNGSTASTGSHGLAARALGLLHRAVRRGHLSLCGHSCILAPSSFLPPRPPPPPLLPATCRQHGTLLSCWQDVMWDEAGGNGVGAGH